MLRWIGTSFASLLNLVLPIYQRARTSQQLGRGIRIALRIIFIVVACIALTALGYYTRIEDNLKINNPPLQWLGPYFYTALFLLVCGMCWLSWLFWLLLFAETDI